MSDLNAIKDLVKVTSEKSYLSKPTYGYHYTKACNVKNILCDDKIHFHLTKIEDFYDKFEGKSIEVYYDLALEKLFRDNFITQNEYNSLSTICPSNYILFPVSDQENKFFNRRMFDTFILCFSKNRNDEFMYKNYANNQDNPGYCIGFSLSTIESIVFNSVFNAGIHIDFYEVLYGEQIVIHLIKTIKDIVTVCRRISPDAIFSFVNCIIPELDQLRYSAKLGKYYKENEIRMVIKCPKNNRNLSYSGSSFTINRIEFNKREIIDFGVYKSVFKELLSDSNGNPKYDEELRETIKNRGYIIQ